MVVLTYKTWNARSQTSRELSLRRRWKAQRSRASHVREGDLEPRDLLEEVVWDDRRFEKGASERGVVFGLDEVEGFSFFVDVPVISNASLSFGAPRLLPKWPNWSFNWVTLSAWLSLCPENLVAQHFIGDMSSFRTLNAVFGRRNNHGLKKGAVNSGSDR